MKASATLVSLLIFALSSCGQEIKSLAVSPSSVSFDKVGATQTLSVKALDIDDAQVPGVSFAFRAENDRVVSVDSSGTVKALGNGSSAVIVETTAGISGEMMVKVCLPKEIVCEPQETLALRVGSAAPLRCHATDCKDVKLRDAPSFTSDPQLAKLETDNIFTGVKAGDSEIAVKIAGLEKKIKVKVEEPPEPPSGAGKPGRGGSVQTKDQQDAERKGSSRFDGLLQQMKTE